MWILWLLLLVSLVVAENVTDEQLYLQSTHKFVHKFYKAQKLEITETSLINPTCMQSLLALLHAGAQGETATQIAEALSLSTEQVQRVYTKALTSDQNGKSYSLQIGHKMYIQKDYNLTDGFNRTAKEEYNTDIEFLDFIGGAEEALAKINGDIERATTVKNFLSLDKLKDSNIFIYSTFFYRSELVIECPIRRRISAIFFETKHRRRPIGFGEFVGYFNFYESDRLGAKFLEIPYQGNQAVITVILPNTLDGLFNLEENFMEVLQHQNLTRTKVVLRLPDINVQSKIEIVKIFRNIGITKAFSRNESHFEGITRSNHLYFTTLTMEIFHRMHFEPTSESRRLLRNNTLEVCPIADGASEFIANHPFLYTVSVRKTGSVLLLGKVT